MSDLIIKLIEIQEDVYRLKDNLPYRVLTMTKNESITILRNLKIAKNWKMKSLKCGRLIEQTPQSIEEVKNRYRPENDEIMSIATSTHSAFGDIISNTIAVISIGLMSFFSLY